MANGLIIVSPYSLIYSDIKSIYLHENVKQYLSSIGNIRVSLESAVSYSCLSVGLIHWCWKECNFTAFSDSGMSLNCLFKLKCFPFFSINIRCVTSFINLFFFTVLTYIMFKSVHKYKACVNVCEHVCTCLLLWL